MNPPLVVFDTMVLLQSAVNPDRRHATMQIVESRRAILAVSRELLDELRDVLHRPTMRQKFPALVPTRIDEFITSIEAIAMLVEPVPALFTWP